MPGGIRCSVGICKSHYGKTQEHISFFTFPKDAVLRKQWIQKCYRMDNINPKTARICSLHFKESDFQRNLKAELLNIPSRKLLNADAVPSINLKLDKMSIKSFSREMRMKSRERHEIIHDVMQQSDILPMNEPVDDQRPDYDTLMKNYNCLQEENKDLKLKLKNNIRRNKINIFKYKEKICELEEIIKNIKSSTAKMEKRVAHLFSEQFSKNQMDIILKKKKMVRWTSDELSHAFSIRYFSKRCYVYLRETLHYPLPGISTLQRWASKINLRTGLLLNIIKFMAILGESMTEFEKICILSFDEMKVCSSYEYDQLEDEVVGPHTYMQVIMARGLFSKWKQPVYINFDTKMTTEILYTVISHLHNISYNVVACASDCGGGNIGLWRDLGITIEKVHFPHPITKDSIFVFADAPHLLKLVRNWLLDTGFILEDQTVINKLPITTLIEETNTEINSCFHLRKIHIECERSERQNVLLAAQLLSHRTATALRHYHPGPNKKLAIDVANFIELCNSWFDIMNSFSLNVNVSSKKPYGTSLEEQNKILDDMVNCFTTMKCQGKNAMQLFQKGVCISTKSLQQLYLQLQLKYDVKYLLTHRLNQDVLENLFSQIRTRGGLHDHPSPLNALYRIRMILLGKNQGVVKAVNTKELEETEFMFGKIFKQMDLSIPTVKFPSESENTLISEDSDSTSVSSSSSLSKKVLNTGIKHFSEKDGLIYIAGFIAKKFKNKYKEMGKSTKQQNPHSYSIPSWVQHLSFGGLIEPSKKWKNECLYLERRFCKFHKNNTIRKGKNITKKTAVYLNRRNIHSIPLDVILEYSRQSIFMRIKYLNNLKSQSTFKRKCHSSNKVAKKMRKIIN